MRELRRTGLYTSLAVLFFCDSCAGQTISQLPAPTGKYAVGREVFAWVDPTRWEPTSKEHKSPRELVVYVWFPAVAPTDIRVPYLEPAQLQISAFANIFGTAWKAVQDGAITTHTWRDAKPLSSSEPLPLLLFSPGLGAPTAAYTFLLEDLASHGYIVAAVEHTHVNAPVALPDKRIVPMDFDLGGPPLADDDQVDFISREMRTVDLCAADLQFVLDQMGTLNADRKSMFFKKADVKHTAVFGHSVGGRVAVRACQRDARFRACLNQDGTIFFEPFVPDDTGRPLMQPFMMIDHVDSRVIPDAMFKQMHTTREEYDRSRRQKIETVWRTTYRSVLGGSYEVTIKVPDAIHGSFSDQALLRAANQEQAVHQARIMELDRKFTRVFFDLTLRNGTDKLLPSSDDEVTVRTFLPAATLPSAN